MKLKTFIQDFINVSKAKISDLATKELTNEEKKLKLDEKLIGYTNYVIKCAKLGFIPKFIVNKYILPMIPSITQAIFDLLKTKIEGVTK